MTEPLKQTPLHAMHVGAGAKMGGFAGYDMPLFYPLGVMKEHLHTRTSAGLFDISHMMHVEIGGLDAAACISRLCPYEAAEQPLGSCKYTFFLNDRAGIIDDLIVTNLGADRYLLVCNAGCAEKDEAHIRAVAKDFAVEVSVVPRAFLALQGPLAETVLTNQGIDVASMAFMTGGEPQEGWFVSRTGYTGEDGFEIGLPEDEVVEFAKALVADARVEWIGLGARDSLRLEAGLSLYGNDLDEDTTPHEAGLIWAIAKELRHDGGFIGAEALSKAIEQGRKRMRIGLVPEGRPVRGGADLVNEAGAAVGKVTSGGFGPTLEGPMALAMVDIAAADAPIFADIRGKRIAMTRTKVPFVAHIYKK
ncbi:glycine cleavage system aminomethyltransferase GcvT [Pseudahrensia aquimaris]|uniref:aminomethyltransferase n=1 Tax=Pseudahrensia aquimaris TaxID=744461 RepID=A0ABW3FHW7_9HYPH